MATRDRGSGDVVHVDPIPDVLLSLEGVVRWFRVDRARAASAVRIGRVMCAHNWMYEFITVSFSVLHYSVVVVQCAEC